VLTAAAAAFSQVFSWYYAPFFAEGQQSGLAAQFFDLRGVAFAAWTLAAFAIGAFAGMLIRRVVPAMAAAMAAWTGLILATVLYLRRHYQAPLTTKGDVQAPGKGNIPWVISLALPADRGRLAARALAPAHRGDHLAGPPPGRLSTALASRPARPSPRGAWPAGPRAPGPQG
jgi:hypothetical protein